MRVYLRFACPSGSRSVAPGGSHPFQEPRATGVSPLLGVGRTRRRDTLVPHVSSDRRDSSPGQKNDPFPAVSPETRHSGCDLFPISCLFGSVGTLGGLPAYERLPPFDPVSPGRTRRPRSTSENRFAENRSHISPVVVAARLSQKSLIPPGFAVPREGVEKGQSISEERGPTQSVHLLTKAATEFLVF